MIKLFRREPVRAAIYPMLALTVGFLVIKGFLDHDTSEFILSAAMIILIGLGVETARRKVIPTDG
jgi:hypothetical protein